MLRLLLCLLPALAAAQSPVTVLADALATDLSGDAPAAFLGHFDRKMPGYAELEANIYGMCQQVNVTSSVEVVKEDGDARARTAELDWVLLASVKDERSQPLERRRGTVKISLELRGRRWIIVRLEPISFFQPPGRLK